MDEGTVVGRVVDPGSAAPVRFSGAAGGDGVGCPVGVVAGFRVWLGTVDAGALSDAQRVDLVAELERVKGAASAGQARATDAVRCSREVVAPRDVARSVGSVVALARRESPSLGDRFVGLARALVHEMPRTMAALSAGECSERVAVAVVAATATLSVQDRGLVDARVGPLLDRLGVVQAGRAAGRVAAELDAASVVRRMEAAVKSRRVSVRPAPDGMAYLSVLGPLKEVVGAFAGLQARSRAVVSGQCLDEGPQGRGVGAVAADTALALLSGRATGQVQPVEVHLVMTDQALLGCGAEDRSVLEPARIPGHGSVPAPIARAWLREGLDGPPATGEAVAGGPPPSRSPGGAGHAAGSAAVVPPAEACLPAAPAPAGDGTARVAGGPSGTTVPGSDATAAQVWLRRLYTSADGRDLVAMDSRRRLFGGLLRRMLVLRDDVCTTPWCEAPIAHADHTTPVREDGRTTYTQGAGKCARCNQTKEAPGWRTRVAASPARRAVQLTTPLGQRYASEPPPLLGWGSTSLPPGRQAQACRPLVSNADEHAVSQGRSLPVTPTPTPTPERVTEEQLPARAGAGGWPGTPEHRRRPLRRPRTVHGALGLRLQRRPLTTSHLERQLCRYLT